MLGVVGLWRRELCGELCGAQCLLIAYRTSIPNDVGDTMELIQTEEVVDDYIKQDICTIRAETVSDQLLLQETEMKADMIFDVTAKPI